MSNVLVLDGDAYGVSVLFNKGEQRAIFTHKRLREYPISGGPSTLRESIRYPEIEEYALDLLTALNWHGVAMVEFRVDARDGKPKLIEINPGFWTGLPLAIYAGVDFSLSDPLPGIGVIIDGLLSLMSKDRREYVFNRGVDER